MPKNWLPEFPKEQSELAEEFRDLFENWSLDKGDFVKLREALAAVKGDRDTDLCRTLADLVERVDRSAMAADGSTLDTLAAHAVLERYQPGLWMPAKEEKE